jgi:pimeloyl-ACP methyl ester carboxylesterase
MSEPTYVPEWVEIPSGDVVLRGHRWAGDPLTIVLLHAPGDGNDLDRWRPLIPYLIGNKATILAIDLRGHGASDGDWDESHAVTDIATVVDHIRDTSFPIVLCAEGDSAFAALRTAESSEVDGLILLSPSVVDGELPRGAGVTKLIVTGNSDQDYVKYITRLRNASIGPALALLLPTDTQGVDILASKTASTCRAHIMKFLNERRIEARQTLGVRSPRDEFLRRLGLESKGESG